MLARLALAIALTAVATGVAAVQSGEAIFDRNCRTCHGGTRAADSPLGPKLAGIVGSKAGTQPSGLHTRALLESGIVWNRNSLRRFVVDPRGVAPGTTMPARDLDAEELERLLDYLETLR